MTRSRKFIFTLAAATIVLAVASLSAPDATAHLRRGVFEPGVVPIQINSNGTSYGDWAAAWWQWAFALPVTGHPLFDETGANCGAGQSGPVWFLGGVFNVSGTAVRTECKVPSGKALFFPILNVECANVEAAGDTTVDLRKCAGDIADTAADLSLEVDGVSVRSLERFRTLSPAFGFVLPDDNLLQAFGLIAPKGSCFTPEGSTLCEPYLASGDGHYVMLSPLSDGAHTIRIRGSFPTFGFSLDVTYHLTVGA